MKIVFTGESPSREIVIPGDSILAFHGQPVEVPDVLGRSLCEQDVWEPVTPARKGDK